MFQKRTYDDDDGRTIADMSGVQHRPLLIPRLPKTGKKSEESGQAQSTEQNTEQLNSEQRRAAIGGSLLAALAVLLVFAAVIALIIFLLGFFGH